MSVHIKIVEGNCPLNEHGSLPSSGFTTSPPRGNEPCLILNLLRQRPRAKSPFAGRVPHRQDPGGLAATEHTSGRDFAQQRNLRGDFPLWVPPLWRQRDRPHGNLLPLCGRRVGLAAAGHRSALVFQQRGDCGLRLVGEFLRLCQLDRFVAASRGALQAVFAAHLEADLVAFRAAAQPVLAQGMQPQTITAVVDEHFHSGQPCLVGMEPVSGFVLVECYREHRDADTWKAAIQEGTAGLPVEIVQLTSDQARALLCCAEKACKSLTAPTCFTGNRRCCNRCCCPCSDQSNRRRRSWPKPSNAPRPWTRPLEQASASQVVAISAAVREELALQERLAQAHERQQQAVPQVRGLGDDYQPLDRYSGRPLTAEEVGQRLNQHLTELEQVADAADLGEKPRQALAKARPWVTTWLVQVPGICFPMVGRLS